MPHVNRVIVLPGFGDPLVGETWVAELSDRLPAGVELEAIDWPGLWTRCDEPVSFTALVDEVVEKATSRTVLVGHSLGGRVALQLACDGLDVAGAVALCSPAHLRITAPAAAAAWRDVGARAVARVAPNGMPVSFQLPAVFLDELAGWYRGPRVPTAKHLMVFGGADDHGGAAGWDLHPGARQITLPGCEHRFMDHDGHRAAALEAVASFVAHC